MFNCSFNKTIARLRDSDIVITNGGNRRRRSLLNTNTGDDAKSTANIEIPTNTISRGWSGATNGISGRTRYDEGVPRLQPQAPLV